MGEEGGERGGELMGRGLSESGSVCLVVSRLNMWFAVYLHFLDDKTMVPKQSFSIITYNPQNDVYRKSIEKVQKKYEDKKTAKNTRHTKTYFLHTFCTLLHKSMKKVSKKYGKSTNAKIRFQKSTEKVRMRKHVRGKSMKKVSKKYGKSTNAKTRSRKKYEKSIKKVWKKYECENTFAEKV